MMTNPTPIERFQGCLVGAAVGDALAKPAQFLPPDEVAARFGRITEFDRSPDYLYQLLPEQWSDDTHMLLIHAQSIVAQGRLDMDDVARRYLAWRRSGDLRGMNMDLDNAIEGLKAGYDWRVVGRTGDRAGSNNAAVRVAPIGLLHYRDYLTNPDALRQDAHDSAIISHNHPDAIAGAQAVAYAVARLAAGHRDLDTLLADTAAFIGLGKVADALQRAADLLVADTDTADALAELGTGGYAVESVPSAFYCFLRTPSDFEATVISAVMGGDDADVTACLAGGLSGAYNGLAAIPTRWRDEVEDGARLRAIAAQLYLVAGGSDLGGS